MKALNAGQLKFARLESFSRLYIVECAVSQQDIRFSLQLRLKDVRLYAQICNGYCWKVDNRLLQFETVFIGTQRFAFLVVRKSYMDLQMTPASRMQAMSNTP
jgi:hypothetical protein